MLYIGFSMGTVPVISYNYGSRDVKQLKKAVSICFQFIMGISIFVFLLSLLSKESIAKIFAENNRNVYEITKNGFIIFSSALFTALSNGKASYMKKRLENFSVIGKEGSTKEGAGFMQKLWEDHFTEGLYLAGVEVADEAEAPAGWVKWTIPGYEYLYVKCTEEDTFVKVLEYMEEQGIELAGAVHDFNCPEENGEGYMFFPIWRL